MASEGLRYDELHVETAGPEAAPPVLLLHGWGSSAALMAPIARALAPDYRVYNLDLPGHGLSPAPPAPIGVPEHAALVADFIREHIGQPVSVVGHSNGGRISLYMAADPALGRLIRRLVLVSPSGITPKRSWKYYLRRFVARALKAPFEPLPEPLRGFCLDWLRHSLVWKALGSSDYRRLEGSMRETFVKTVNFHVDDAVRRIQAPTLLFWGSRDEAVSRYQMDQLAARIPDAGLVVLDGAGHYGYLDAPAQFIAATRLFLAGGAHAPQPAQPTHV